jgi:hypothetical protein
LKLGTGPEDKPMVNITNYDPIPPDTVVQFYLSGIETLLPDVTTTIKIGFEFYYKDKNQNALLYEPTPFVPLATSLPTSINSLATHFITIDPSSSGTVYGTSTYTFSYQTNTLIKPDDTFYLEFPNDFFET